MIKTSAQEAYYKFAQGMEQEQSGPSTGQIVGGTLGGAALGGIVGGGSPLLTEVRQRLADPARMLQMESFQRHLQTNPRQAAVNNPTLYKHMEGVLGKMKSRAGIGAALGAGALGGGALLHRALSQGED